jgi:hypothetical protein
MAQRPLVSQGLLSEVPRSHSDAPPHLLGLLWTSDHPDTESCTWQHTTLNKGQTSVARAGFEPTIPASRGTRWRSWLRHGATSWQVMGSIPDGVIGIFHWHNPSSRTMALGSTQPLTEMSIRNISWGGKGDCCIGLTTLLPSCADCLEIWETQPPGILRACPGL